MQEEKQLRAYKYRIYPSKKQEELLNHHLWLSKELWNNVLAEVKSRYKKEKKFPAKKELREMVKNKGIKAGFPRFKTFDRMKSIVYPQFGFSLDKKLTATPFGEISIKKHRE